MTELILALDCENMFEAARLVEQTISVVKTYKIGPQLVIMTGSSGIKTLGLPDVMLDLKFHDIPKTVELAVKATCHLRPKFITIHGTGGERMIGAARLASEEITFDGKRPLIISVTHLTSLPAEGINFMINYARMALKAGADGLVCSPLEVKELREEFGPGVVLITPGVRLTGSPTDDHARVATPSEAARNGADYIVVGRPISLAEHPREVAKRIVRELEITRQISTEPRYSEEDEERARMWEMDSA